MGCDIHCFAEVKIGGKWEFYGELDISRDYELFSSMAECGRNGYAKGHSDWMEGMRERWEPIVPNRGLPEDLTFMTRIFYNQMPLDAHGMSWLNRAEVKTIIDNHKIKCNKWDEEDGKDIHGRNISNNWFDFQYHQIGYLFGLSWTSFDPNKREQMDDEGFPKEVEDFRWVFWFDN